MEIKVDLHGDKELRERLSDSKLIAQPLRELLEDASKIGQDAAIKGVDGGTGIATRSILTQVRTMSASVYTMIAELRALSIEKGRPPGDNRWTSDKQIYKWAESVGLQDSLFTIVRGIRQRGARGRFFMQAGREKVQSELPRLLSEMGDKVREIFGR